MTKEVFGHINCPHCGTAKGMRITHDKNGAPFGYCEAKCSGQLKVGGDSNRVAAFLVMYPWAAGKQIQEPAPVPVPVPAAKAAPAPKAAPVPAPAKTAKPGPFDFLLNQGAKA